MSEYVLDIIKQTVEYKNWGWNVITIGSVGTLIFTLFEAWGLYWQTKRIWKEKSGEAVSVTLFTYVFFAFWSFLFYGIYTKSASAFINALMFGIFYIPIVYGLWKFKGFTKREKIQFWVFALMVPAMVLYEEHFNEIFLVISMGMLIATLALPWELYKAKTTGVLEIRLIIVYEASTLFWVIYAFAIEEWVLEILATGNLFIIGGAMVLWFHYYRKEGRAYAT